jgi:hypothetical protein
MTDKEMDQSITEKVFRWCANATDVDPNRKVNRLERWAEKGFTPNLTCRHEVSLHQFGVAILDMRLILFSTIKTFDHHEGQSANMCVCVICELCFILEFD